MTVACGTAVQSVVFSCTRCVSEIPTHGWPSMGCLLVLSETSSLRCAVHRALEEWYVSSTLASGACLSPLPGCRRSRFDRTVRRGNKPSSLHTVFVLIIRLVLFLRRQERETLLFALEFALGVCVCSLPRGRHKNSAPTAHGMSHPSGTLGGCWSHGTHESSGGTRESPPCCRHPHMALEQSSPSRQLEPMWLRMWWWIGRLASMTSVSRCSLSPHSGCSGAPVSDTGCPLNNS